MKKFGVIYCGEHSAALEKEIRQHFGCLLIRKGKRAGFLLIGEEGDDHGLMYGFLKREAKRYGEGNVLTGAADLDLSQLGEVYSPPTFFRRYERKFEPYELAELLRIKK